jgi:hypothetical protein
MLFDHMNNQLYRFKKASSYFALATVIFFAMLVVNPAKAQRATQPGGMAVNVTLNVFPPYSPYYADYSGVNAAKVSLMLQNLTGTTQVIKLAVQLTGITNGVKIATYTNYIPRVQITLNPHEIKQLNGLALKEVFEASNLSVQGIDKAKLGASSRLPEGDYYLCIQAVDYRNGALLSPSGNFGCANINITYPEAPQLSGPANGSTVFATNPQAVIFSWFNAGVVPMGTQYNITMEEMPDISNNPTQVLDATSFPKLSQNLSGLSYLYNVLNLHLVPGKKYAWRVKASDPTGKVLFKNNGVSPASYFIYGNNPPRPTLLANQTPGNLNVTTPSCDTAINPTIVMGKHLDLKIGWMWREQIESIKKFDTLDVALNKNYTQMATAKGMVSLGKYKLEFAHQATGLDGAVKGKNVKGVITYYTDAPIQNFSLTDSAAMANGFVKGEKYRVTVTSLDKNGVVLDQASSCTWLLKQEDYKALPKLQIEGRLVYTLNGNKYHGANNANVSLQLVDQLKSGAIDKVRNYVTVTADAEGNFKADLTQLPTDTGKKYVHLYINNPYYKQIDTNILVKIPVVIFSTAHNQEHLTQEKLKLGDLKTTVFTNNLTVNLKKGYPDQMNPQDYKDLFGVEVKDNLPVKIQNGVVQLARIPDGTHVTLFRASKAIDIPFYEGDDVFVSDKTKVKKIADGLTFDGATGKSKVVFKNLLCNFYDGDEYYIQALLVDTGLNTKEELAGPQQLYTYKPVSTKFLSHFNNAINYNIISQKPPMAHVKGKIMYQWPSTPGVLHPYANKPISIAMVLNTVAKHNICDKVSFDQVVNGAKGIQYKTPWNMPDQNGGMTVGTAKTDAAGNFDMEIVTPYEVGSLNDVVANVTPTPCPESPKTDDKEKGRVIALDKGKVGITKDKGDPGPEAVLSHGFNELTFKEGAFDINEGMGAFSKSLDLPAAKDFGAGNNVDSKIEKANGPSASQEPEPVDGPVLKLATERYFTLRDIPSIYADSSAKVSAVHFVVQPFQTIDLGVVLTQVQELRYRSIKLRLKDTKGNIIVDSTKTNILEGALLTIYRSTDAPALDFMPDGEGSVKHPQKTLVSARFNADPNAPKVEWVKDHSLPFLPTNDFTISLDTMRLVTDIRQYSFQISPNPESTGGYFVGNDNYKPVNRQGNSPNLKDPDVVDVMIAPTRVAGRILDAASALPLANAAVGLAHENGYGTSVKTDKDGYFEFINYQVGGVSWKDDDKMYLKVQMPGYTDLVTPSVPLKEFGKKYYYPLSLVPAGAIKFNTLDAVTFNSVDAYAMAENKNLVDNFTGNPDHRFVIPVAKVGAHTVNIYPVDPAYFEDTVAMNDNGAMTTVKLYKRNHRMQFHLINANHTPVDVSHFKIIINDIDPETDLSGMGLKEAKDMKALMALYKPIADKQNQTISFDFQNVSVNNYSIQVINTGDEGYVPQKFNLSNKETRQPVLYPVYLERGALIKGTVTYNNAQVEGAHVYLDYAGNADADYKNGSGGINYNALEAVTQHDGTYKIKGIPASFTGKNVSIHATLSIPGTTVNGATKTILLTSAQATNVDFALAKFEDKMVAIDNIYGFPLSVEHIEKLPGDGYTVDGTLDLASKNNSPFKLSAGTNKIKVTGVHFIKQKSGNVYIPAETSVNLTAITSLKMRYLDQYNVKLVKPNKTPKPNLPLAVEKSGAGGLVKAHVSITDNSFNYPSSYLSFAGDDGKTPVPFYLFDPALRSSGEKPVVDGIYTTPAKVITYHLSDAVSDSLKFSFIGFPTKADPNNSYIDPSSKQFHLDATFSGPVPNSDQGYVKVRVKDLQLDGFSIKPVTGADPLVVDLQTWKLIVQDWKIDPKLGGISSSNAYVSTGVVDIPARTFNLRSDLFVLDNFKVDSVKLGGDMILLKGLTTETAHIVFDQACGSDHQQHWRFAAISPDNGTVATIPLPAIANKIAAANLGVNYFQLISYNKENIIGLSPNPGGMKLYNNKMFTFYPSFINSQINNFSLTGSATIDVPRISGETPLTVHYTRPPGGKMDMNAGDFAPIKFEGKGYVQFTSDAGALFTTDNYTTSITGKVVEPGKFNPIPCTLSFGESVTDVNAAKNYGSIILKKGYDLRIDGTPGEQNALKEDTLTLAIGDKDQNRMLVDAGSKDWGTLRFSGMMNDRKATKISGKEKSMSTPTVYTFDVYGDLSVGADGVNMSNVNTPLGNLTMSYDFKTHELHGALHLDEIAFGSYKFTGDIQTTMGPNGMLMLGAGSLNTGALLVQGFGTLNIGLLFASTDLTDDNIHTVTEYSRAPQNICWLRENRAGFKGFFFTGGYDILNEHHGFDIGIASVYFNAVLGVEASIGANFKADNYMALIGAHGDLDAGLNAITGTSISGGLHAHLTAQGTYSTNGFAVTGDAGVTVDFTVSQYIPIIGTQSFNASKGALISFGLGGGQKAHVDFSLNDGGNPIACAENSPKP